MLLFGGCISEDSRQATESAGGTSGAGRSAKSETIIYADEHDPRTLDPAGFEDAYDNFVSALVHQGLVRFGESTNIVPGLARSWELAEDGLMVTFTLREAKYHNGKTVDSYDVKYSITRVLDPASASQRSWMFEPYLVGWDEVEEGDAAAYAQWVRAGRQGGAEADPGLRGIETPDERTVVFRLNRPYLPMLTLLSMPNGAIVPLGSGEEEGWPAGAGPWKVDSWAQGERLRMSRFEDYWEGPAEEPHLLLRAIADSSTWRAEFDAGNVDFYTVSEADFRTWRNDPEKKELMRIWPELNVYYLALNMSRPPFDDIRLRQALAYGINVEEIFTYIHLEKGRRAHGPVPPGIVGFTEGEPVAYDPERAKELIAEAGAKGLRINFYYPTDELMAQICQAAAADMKELGLEVNLRNFDRAAFREALNRGEPDMHIGNWWADYPDIENFIYPLYHSAEIDASNPSRFSDPEVDTMIDEARYHPDPDERIALFQKIEDRVIEAFPMVFLWHRHSYIAVKPRIEGFVPHSMLNGVDFHDVSIEP